MDYMFVYVPCPGQYSAVKCDPEAYQTCHPFVYVPNVYWKMVTSQNVTPVTLDLCRSTTTTIEKNS